MPSASHLLLVHTRPVAGLEYEFATWYDEIHLAEVLSVPGFTGVQRFRGEDGHFVAVFRIESADIATTMDLFKRAQPYMQSTRALDESSVRFDLLNAVGPGRGGFA